MGIRIFDVDPDAKPKSQFSDDVVGRFRSGAQLNGNPTSLTEWRVTTGDPDVADAIAELLGGTPEQWDTSSEETIEVYTDAPEVDVVLDGPGAIRTSMVLWGRKKMIRSCDGVTQGDEAHSPCVCPSTVKERKEAAKAGHGCEPSIQVYFRLKDAPELGKFKFFSGSWSFAGDIGEAEERLAEIDGPALATISLETIEFEAKSGPKKGQKVSFIKPVVEVHGPAPEEG